MKKTIALVSLFLVFAVPAFATELTIDTSKAGYVLQATTPASTTIAKLSKGVVIGSQYTGTGYAIDTYHLQGTKLYGTAYDSTAIYFKDVGANATVVAPTSSVTSEAFGTGWTSM
jgi:hypothetical protein